MILEAPRFKTDYVPLPIVDLDEAHLIVKNGHSLIYAFVRCNDRYDYVVPLYTIEEDEGEPQYCARRVGVLKNGKVTGILYFAGANLLREEKVDWELKRDEPLIIRYDLV